METRTKEQLIKEATRIIGWGRSTTEDIKTLTQLRFFLSIHYKDTNMEWSAKEGMYNQDRAKQTVELQETMAVGKAENQAKAMAEINYGNYRELNAEAQGISKLLDAINGYIINIQVENKTGNQAQF